ncbi:MAG: response regulator [Nitrospirota bacterium]|nr:response regulator [Nitrospirota bacterium]
MKKILIIEDDKKITKSLSIRLKSSGFVVAMAEDAMMGVRAAVQDKPDLILLDIGMPGGGGFSVMQRVQMNPTAAMIPVILITASKRPEYRKQAEELGAVAFFEKPFDSDQLLNAIRETLVLGEPTAGSIAS